MSGWASIINSLAIIGLCINVVLHTRWLSKLSRRVLDLEYPQQNHKQPNPMRHMDERIRALEKSKGTIKYDPRIHGQGWQ